MHAGDLVERGPGGDVLRRPLHPYTRSLRDAEAPLEGPRRELPSIAEFMPGLRAMAALPGCRFAGRCPSRNEACAASRPPLLEPVPGRFVRCAPACLQTEEERPAPGVQAGAGDPVFEWSRAEQPIIEFDCVDLTYSRPRGLFGARRSHVHAVRGASFKVLPGKTLGIVGESGSGKSSIARLALGLEQPTAGRITLDGRPALPLRDGVQIVFQDPQSALNPRRRVLRLVTQPMEARAHAVPPPQRLARALELLRETGLPQDCLVRFPGQLSGGQRQRVNIARALCVTPRLLVADEIVSGLDVSVQAQILNLLARTTKALGLALLFISHDLSVIRYLCAQVLVMCRGEIVEAGPTAELFARPRHPYTRALLAAVPPDDPDRPWPPEPEVLSAAPT
jgi:dipeptide transport system ATP-binding protein